MKEEITEEKRKLVIERIKELRKSKKTAKLFIFAGACFILSILGSVFGIILLISGIVWKNKLEKEELELRLKYGN